MDPFKNGSCRTYGSDDKENLYYKNFGSMYSREVCSLNFRLSENEIRCHLPTHTWEAR